MDEPELTTVSQGVDRLMADLYATEMVVYKTAGKFVMVAGDKHHMAAFARFAQQLLHHVVVRLRPIPFALELPAINDVADEIQMVTGMRFEKFNQSLCLTARCSQMQV